MAPNRALFNVLVSYIGISFFRPGDAAYMREHQLTTMVELLVMELQVTWDQRKRIPQEYYAFFIEISFIENSLS